MMTFNTEGGWSYNGDSYILKDTFMNDYPAQFYTLYFRLNPQDPLTEAALSLELREGSPTSGAFCSPSKTLTNWVCGIRPEGNWVDVGGGCFHQATQTRCQ